MHNLFMQNMLGSVAQLVEQPPFKRLVASSNLAAPIKAAVAELAYATDLKSVVH